MMTLTALMTLSLFSNATKANENYSAIKVCGDRALVVDQKEILIRTSRGDRGTLQKYQQLVLTNKEIIRDFISRGAIDPVELNYKGEFIVELTKESYSDSEFYGIRAGKTTTVKLYGNQVALAVYSHVNDGSRLLADFFFTNCR